MQDGSTGLGLFLMLAALAVTVTPRIQNGWIAAIAWLLTAAYAVWLTRAQREPFSTFVSQHPWQTTLLASLVAAVAVGGFWRNIVVPFAHAAVAVEPASAVGTQPLAATDETSPRLVLEKSESVSPFKLVGGSPERGGIAAKQISYAKITVKNDPPRAGPNGVAKDVTAHVVFSSPVGHHLTVQAEWDKGKPIAPGKAIDNFSGHGTSVWFDVGQRRDLILAFKVAEDEHAYVVKEQPYVPDTEVRAPGLALPAGN